MKKFMDMLNINNWEENHPHNEQATHSTQKALSQKATVPQNNKNYEIPSTPTYKQRLQIEADFPYIPFIKHCATNYAPNATNYVFPNLNEQHQILYFVDSFNESLFNIRNEIDINDLHIFTESIKFGYRNNQISEPMTFIHFSPYTKTGKKAKFPVAIIFSTEESNNNYFSTSIRDYETGRIDFMKDGNIGKARITLFRNNFIYGVHYKMFGASLIIDQVTKTSRIGGESAEIYRNESAF